MQIGQILDILFRKLGYDKKIREQRAMLLWNEIAGEHVAFHAQPTQIDNGKMSVVVSDSVWLTELSLLKMQYIARINEEMGNVVVKEIDFKVGKVKKPKPPQRIVKIDAKEYNKKLENIELEPEELKLISQIVADVADEELVNILKRIFTSHSKSIKLKSTKEA